MQTPAYRGEPSALLSANAWRLNPASMAMYLTGRDPLPWRLSRHLRLLSERIVDAVMGKTPRLIINMPPRHGKSELISKWTPLWFLDNFPHEHVIDISYSTTYAEEWGRKVRNLASLYRDQLNFAMSPDSTAAGRWNTTEGGGMYATGIDGQLTGRGGKLFIIDDPHKDANEANSLLARDKVWTWWQETAISRIHPGAAVILLMTRWHEDDFAGRLIKASEDGTGQHWDVLNLPAIAGTRNVDGDWVASEPPDVLGRAPGEPLWPEFRPLDYLLGIAQGASQEAWEAQYQGTPGNRVKAGNTYRSFHKVHNVRPCAFDPHVPIEWSMDFNVDPMCSTLSQTHEQLTATSFLTNERHSTISVLDELCLPNSTTEEMCEEFCNRTTPYVLALRGKPLRVRVYGDRSGQSRKTSGTTDYDIVKDFFRTRPQYSFTWKLTNKNPGVKDRVNAVNMMLCNTLGERRTFIDPRCGQLILDFLQVRWKRDSSGNVTGNIDKTDQQRTHVSDAFGYRVEKDFGLKKSKPGAGTGFVG